MWLLSDVGPQRGLRGACPSGSRPGSLRGSSMRAVKVSGTRAAVSVMGVALAAFSVDALAVDEVIVTTRKREENLQQVPIAVEALTAEMLEEKGIVSLKDVVEQSSSV